MASLKNRLEAEVAARQADKRKLIQVWHIASAQLAVSIRNSKDELTSSASCPLSVLRSGQCLLTDQWQDPTQHPQGLSILCTLLPMPLNKAFSSRALNCTHRVWPDACAVICCRPTRC